MKRILAVLLFCISFPSLLLAQTTQTFKIVGVSPPFLHSPVSSNSQNVSIFIKIDTLIACGATTTDTIKILFTEDKTASGSMPIGTLTSLANAAQKGLFVDVENSKLVSNATDGCRLDWNVAGASPVIPMMIYYQ